MYEEWVRPPDKAGARTVPPAQRSDGSDIRRNYNLMISRQKDKITPENEEFFEPEHLKQEKYYVMREIQELEREIKPLRAQCKRLLAQKEKVLPSPTKEQAQVPLFFTDSIEESKSPEMLERDLARERRHFSEGNRFRLQYEVSVAYQERDEMIKATEAAINEIENRKAKLHAMANSGLANTIKKQDSRIEELQRTLHELKQEEQDLKEAAREYMRESTMNAEDEHEIEMLKKKLENINTQQLRKSKEYRIRRNELEKRVNSLKQQIEMKKKKKEEIDRRDNWKKKLKIEDIVVPDDMDDSYTNNNQNRLPPLVSKSVRPINNQTSDGDY